MVILNLFQDLLNLMVIYMQMKFILILFHLLLIALPSLLFAVDWPMWRFDAGRTAATTDALEAPLNMVWVQHFTARESVWDDPLNQDLMPYDRQFEPIIMGQRLFVGFNDCDKVMAFDLESGKPQWTYYADGPVRLPLTGWKDRVYFTSDDGSLTCLSAARGNLLWKFSGTPDGRKILGNKRLISMWPARGGAVIKDGRIYFATSIWPMMGIFIYALDAASGEVIWRNEEAGTYFIKQPHNYPAFAGIAPQGAFAINGSSLLIPGGRSVPACFDLDSGRMRYYQLAKYGKTGGAFISTRDSVFFNHDRDRMTNLYDLNTGELLLKRPGKYPVLAENMFYFSGETISAHPASTPDSVLWSVKVDASGDLILAGNDLFAGGRNTITMLQTGKDGKVPQIIWHQKIEGDVKRLITANGYLVAVTDDGKIAAFAQRQKPACQYLNEKESLLPPPEWLDRAKTILKRTNVSKGYAVIFDVGNGDLLAALARISDLDFIGIDPDSQNINRLRCNFDAQGLYGKRISLLTGTLQSVQLPSYFASLTLLGEQSIEELNGDKKSLRKLIHVTRPYDGKIWLPADEKERDRVGKNLEHLGDENIGEEVFNDGLVLSRDGPLPGSDDWTHQYGDIHNSVKSDDKQVRMPLGLLWFGGNSNLDVLPRHGHGPPEQVVGGRLIIEGIGVISARDVYTGRVLWKTPLDSLATFKLYYNETYQNTPLESSYNQRHIPGANGRGTNFVVAKDFVYVVQGSACEVLDIQSGKPVKRIYLPSTAKNDRPMWGYIGIYKNYLIAGSEYAEFSKLTPLTRSEEEEISQLSLKKFTDLRDKTNYDLAASQQLIILDRFSGEPIWQIKSRYGFIHNAIVAGADKLYCLDKLPSFTEGKMERRGLELPEDYRLMCLDMETGDVIWNSQQKIFGSWLGYSKETGLLLQASRPSGDMLSGENGERMIVYQAENGQEIWDRFIIYENPPILHNNRIITDHIAINIFNGEQIYRKNPISMKEIPWTYTRTKGCNYNIASENLLSFRTSAAGFFDLEKDGGVGHFGGFKSGCTSNLIAANGVLNAPDYTRTCQCAYQNQTSLALVHMPDVEYWTTSDYTWDGKPVKKIGINLNAPGDRMAENDVLWLDFPSIGGDSPDIPVEISAVDPQYIRRHSFFLPEFKECPWVSSSAITGLQTINITLSGEEMTDATYTIRLYFAELQEKKAGERVFDVMVQGKPFLTNFDIARESGEASRDIVKSIKDVKVVDILRIDFRPSAGTRPCQSILSGIEIVSDDYKPQQSESR